MAFHDTAGFARDAPNENPFLETPNRPNQSIFDRAFFKGLRGAIAKRKGPCAFGCVLYCIIVVGIILLILFIK
jgi:hypothetical protein